MKGRYLKGLVKWLIIYMLNDVLDCFNEMNDEPRLVCLLLINDELDVGDSKADE